MKEQITSFKGKYFFLSNFYPSPVTYHGFKFSSNEAAFQAMKCPDKASEFTALSPSDAKREGRRVTLRPDWEKAKEQIMYEICLAKFQQNPSLKIQLLNTGDAELIEGNDWGDINWGVCDGQGENRLGKILMRVRNELR